MEGACSTKGKRKVYRRFWWGKLREIRSRWEDNKKLDLQKVGCGHGQDLSSGSGRGRLTGTCEYGNEHSGSIRCGEFLD